MNLIRIPARRQSGFSLVELMVGMVIGLIAIVVMFQVFSVTEGQRRTTTGAGDAQQNGVASLYVLERDARSAGYGFNYTPLFGCNTLGLYNPTGTPIGFRLLPMQITNGSGHAPDEITFVFGSSDSFAMPGALAVATNNPAIAGRIRLKDPRAQFLSGDLFIAAEVPEGPPGTPVAKNCLINQVTDITATPDSDFMYGAPSYIDANGSVKLAEYSNGTSFGVVYVPWNPVTKPLGTGAGGRVINMGGNPVAATYRITNGQLVATNAFLPNSPSVISDGIVQMQMQYGYSWNCPPSTTSNPLSPFTVPCRMDSAATSVGTIVTANTVNQWGDAMPVTATPTDWRKIVAVRMALVARSSTPERKNALGDCEATTTQPVWPTTGSTLWVDADPDWRCFRYKVFELVVPLRNLMWYPDPNGSPVPQ